MTRCLRCRARLLPSATKPRRWCGETCRQAVYRARRKRSVHFSSTTDQWSTPDDTYAALNAEFGFELDVCATDENAKCERYFTRADDGLAQLWTGVCWMNPPYGRAIGGWVRKAWESAQDGATVVCLVPARVDTAWWHDYCARGEVRLLRGRLRFGNASSSAPFPSAVVVFRPGFRDRNMSRNLTAMSAA